MARMKALAAEYRMTSTRLAMKIREKQAAGAGETELRPLRVRAEGMDLEGEDLLVCATLDRAWLNGLAAGLEIPPPKRDEDEPPPPRWWSLQRGDRVLLGVSRDGQTYYLLEKLVTV